MTTLVDRLRRGEPVDEPVALVVAHPDDETLGLGSRLRLFRRLRLIHLTDGAPRDLADARRVGFPDARSYADARERELAAALRRLGVRDVERLRYDAPDQEAVFAVADLAVRLAGDLAGMRAVVTHAFEQGHPDHDAASLAVHLACASLAAPPAVYEFAGYALLDGAEAYGRFRPHPDAPETRLALDEADRRKAEALACFRTQAAVLARFPLAPERIRPAPRYDFAAPFAPGSALYDRWGLSIDSASWREAAMAALRGKETAARLGAAA